MAERPPGQRDDAVRIAVEEAGVLQGFRADYPWQGSRSRCFLQIGNAVCPPLARLVISGVAGSDRVGQER